MRNLILSLLLISSATLLAGEGYKVGDKVTDFKLKNIDGTFVSLADFGDAKGYVVIFTCNHCPFSKAYEDRIIAIDKKYKEKGYPVIAINPNDPELVPDDSFDKMKLRAKEKGFTFPYLYDESQETYRTYGATRTPHVYLLNKKGNDLVVEYIGTIDDNYQDASAVQEKFLANAIDALIAGKNPDPDFTKAVGCTIKDKSKK